MKKWAHPKTKTGDAVTGDYYLRRPKLNDQFWSIIEKGSDVLFVAPRRVGKTSIMKDLEANAPENVYCIYRNVEGATSKQLFYKRIFEMLLIRLSRTQKATKLFGVWAKKYGIGKIGFDGFEIARIPNDYYVDVVELLKQVSEEDITIILFIDEFVEVILNLTA
nr:hypothetical protein [uncultured Draconibacterium sp.]